MKGSCHCGAIRMEVDHPPDQITDCNCSLCQRLGTLWAYYPLKQFRVEQGGENLGSYIQGERTLATRFCRTCGCTSHWEGLPGSKAAPGGEKPRVGVNMLLFGGLDLEAVPVRKLDGASF